MMKISEVMAGLQAVLDRHGDIDCYYASDDEGNEFRAVHNEAVIMHKIIDDDNWMVQLISDEDKMRYDPEFLNEVCVIN